MALTSFEYPLLDKTKSQIRLLEILPQPDSSLHYSLSTFDVSTCPPYIALSYVWGNDEPRNTIVINGQDFVIRDNLNCALPRLPNLRETGKRSLLKPSESRPEKHFWIDAICINQSDTKERNHQVEMMKDIFTGASLTAAWLGSNNEDQGWLGSRRVYEDLESLARNPYFKRMWIVQEVILSREIWVICGSHVRTWADLKRLCSTHCNPGLVEPEVIPDPDVYSWTNYGKLHFRDQNGASRDEMAYLHSLVWSRAAHAIRRPTLAELLYLYLDRECHDVRDRLYALLGLLSPEISKSSPLPVDYDISRERLAKIVHEHLSRNWDTARSGQFVSRDWDRNLRIALNLNQRVVGRFSFERLRRRLWFISTPQRHDLETRSEEREVRNILMSRRSFEDTRFY